MRNVASWSWLIGTAARLRDRKGLFFKTSRAELRVDCLICGQDAALAIVVSPAIDSFVAFLTVRAVSVDDRVCDGRLVVSVCTTIIVLVLGRI